MIGWANDTEMGLAAYVYAGDVGRAMGIAERIEAGMVGVNRGAMSDPAAPFGGMKQSGLGREGAHEGIYEFCETQYIAAEVVMNRTPVPGRLGGGRLRLVSERRRRCHWPCALTATAAAIGSGSSTALIVSRMWSTVSAAGRKGRPGAAPIPDAASATRASRSSSTGTQTLRPDPGATSSIPWSASASTSRLRRSP